MSFKPPKVIVLDRDGVINRDSPDYIKSPEEWHALPGSLEAIARLRQAGFILAIATNQSGVGRGLFTLDTLWDIHQKMLAEIASAGGYIEKIFFCVHAPNENCDCRKPKPGLLLQVAEVFACGFENILVIGDSARDIEAAQAIGVKSILLRTGNGLKAEQSMSDAERPPVYDDLAAATTALLEDQVDFGE